MGPPPIECLHLQAVTVTGTSQPHLEQKQLEERWQAWGTGLTRGSRSSGPKNSGPKSVAGRLSSTKSASGRTIDPVEGFYCWHELNFGVRFLKNGEDSNSFWPKKVSRGTFYCSKIHSLRKVTRALKSKKSLEKLEDEEFNKNTERKKISEGHLFILKMSLNSVECCTGSAKCGLLMAKTLN